MQRCGKGVFHVKRSVFARSMAKAAKSGRKKKRFRSLVSSAFLPRQNQSSNQPCSLGGLILERALRKVWGPVSEDERCRALARCADSET
jgi:hypothetical protein